MWATRCRSSSPRAGLGAPDGTDVAGRLEPLRAGGPMLAAVFASLTPAAESLGLLGPGEAERLQAAFAGDIRDHGDHALLWPLLIGAWKRRE